MPVGHVVVMLGGTVEAMRDGRPADEQARIAFGCLSCVTGILGLMREDDFSKALALTYGALEAIGAPPASLSSITQFLVSERVRFQEFIRRETQDDN